MKRIRRLTIEIERRALTWSACRGGETNRARVVSVRPGTLCPTCGSPCMLLHDANQPEQSYLQAVLESFDLHTHISSSGHLWICQQSFQHLRPVPASR